MHTMVVLTSISLSKANTLEGRSVLENKSLPLRVELVNFQEVTVTGKVLDEDKNPVIGAAVQVKGTSRGMVTGVDGSFSIKAKAGDVLMISSIGFTKQEITVEAGKTVYSVTLTGSKSTLEEVVVTGYSSQKVKDLTGSVAVVNMKSLKAQPAASPVEALQGKATGVQVISDGAPGATPQIRIRGYSTINNNDPLYVVDGVPYEGKLSWLSQSDIESMQVLKDASSASIYGARANNGVVIVTTKKGVMNSAPRVTLDMYYGTQRAQKSRFPEFMTPTEYSNFLWQSYINAGKTPGTDETTGSNYGYGTSPTLPEYLLAGTATGQKITAADADPSKYNYSRDAATFYQITKANKAGTNWFDEMTDAAPMQNYQIGISGGGEGSRYSLSSGYFNQKGIVKHTGYERYNVRSNSEFTVLNNKVKIGENFQYSFEQFYGQGVNPNVSGDYQGEGSTFGFAYRMPTIIPVYDINGNFAGSRGDKLGNAQNPVAMLYRNKDNVNKRNFFFGNAYVDAEIIKGLNLKTNIGVRFENYSGVSFTYPNLEFSEGSNANGMSEYQGINRDWTWTNTLNYKKSFGKHDINVLVGTEAIDNRNRQLNGNRNTYFLLGNMDYYYLNAGSTNIGNSSTGNVGSLFSYFGRIDYNYSSKYLLSVTVRRDGSSNFGPTNKYGTFPAVSGAWRISEEDFLKGNETVNDLKLRAGYGITGNQRIAAYQYLKRFRSSIAESAYPITGVQTGVWQNAYDNPDIKWEQLKSLNIGLDFTLLNGAFDGSFDWYNRKTSDMLFTLPLPNAAVGMGSSPAVNVGDMSNKGFEFTLGYHYGQTSNKDFQFDIVGNFSRNINKIVKLSDGVDNVIYGDFRSLQTSILKTGQPFGAFYGYKTNGLYKSQDDITKGPSYAGARVGGLRYVDVSGDGQITDADRTILGSPHPDFLYSFSLNARYKNWDVSAFFNGSQGNKIYEATRYYTDFGTFDGTASKRLLNAWNPTTNPNSNIPSPYRGAGNMELASNDYYVQDGSYFRMKNIQIGYTFKTKMLGNYIKGLRVYGSATNLFTITKYTGLDPEVSQTNSAYSALGVDFGIYPVGRQYLVGLSANF
ncbi:TonB-linked SusC/RagA family outer membrane protein [Chitinophaga skermanii]|uniref:TonB-linked SusC/RagA family outer membrane protein n=2 Tax=Chitinophaga skermanii TaxID=331697 RepID=A0A327QVX3_9BACT|nr:TonB-linked SusC/RagA family outer membrane protein [Chitinophaga skermanii]